MFVDCGLLLSPAVKEKLDPSFFFFFYEAKTAAVKVQSELEPYCPTNVSSGFRNGRSHGRGLALRVTVPSLPYRVPVERGLPADVCRRKWNVQCVRAQRRWCRLARCACCCIPF